MELIIERLLNFKFTGVSFWVGFTSVIILAVFALVTKVSSFKILFTKEAATNLFKKQIPLSLSVALCEEILFRFMFITLIGYNLTSLVVTSLIFSATHFTHGMYKDVAELRDRVALGVGLFILGIVLFQIYRIPFANISYHAAIITGVTFTTFFLKPEASKNWLWWDEGHRLIRTPAAWLIMLVGMFLILFLNNLNILF